ncbi:MAG: response regulator [Candidatus Omnitrophica bacterium]|nr:response regulator [Candidatus Omnitrophota bacterium]
MRKKILICDDEEGIRESLNLILEKDYELVFAADGEQCLNNLRNDKNIGLLLLDIKMPKTTGLDILKEAKSISATLKVIIVTGYKSVETATEAAKLGAIDYIVKPFESKSILKKVKEAYI